MANYQTMINQLLRQKDNIDELINQYSQPPVQNIINTGSEFEAKILENEDAENVFVSKRTMLLDKKNKRLVVKETDGRISEEYEIVLPLEEKDKKILELETKLKEMEDKINGYSESIVANGVKLESNADVNGNVDSSTEADSKDVSKSTKRKTSRDVGELL